MKVWVYLDGSQQGPFEDTELNSLPGFCETTKVWFEGLPKWYDAGSLDELRHLFVIEEIQQPATDDMPLNSSGNVIAEAPLQEMPPERPAFLNPEPQPAFAAATPTFPTEPCPATYLGLAIFLFICCCSPFSLAALAGSICVSEFYSRGKLDKARKASEVTAWLIMISLALGMIPVILMSAFIG